MKNNKFYSVLVNGLVVKEGKILISQRDFTEKHEPGSWTIPGGKVENQDDASVIFDIVETTLAKEIREEVGLEITGSKLLIANNIFQHTEGHYVLALVFLCEYKSGVAQALEDTMKVAWISANEINNYNFAPNVITYLAKGFAMLPYLNKRKPESKSS